jgi:probable HAF family extracellular repeat protein
MPSMPSMSAPAASAGSSSSPASSPTTPPAAAPAPAPSSASATPLYEVVEIPRLAATGSVTANAANAQGIVVGEQETTAASRAWIYQESSGALDELSLDPSEAGAYANGISDSGVIAGAEVPAGQPPIPGFWTVSGGAMLLMPYQYSAQAAAANDTGTIIGNQGGPGTVSSQPLVWTAPGYGETTLPGLRCDHCNRVNTTAAAVNDSGAIVGSSSYDVYDSNGNYVASGLHAVEWQSGSITDLGALQSADTSAAYSVNGSGDIVGGSRADQSSGAPTHAFLYHAGTMTDLGTLAGDTNSTANSIDDSGQVVGQSQSSTATRAFLYESGRMYDLNTLIDPASPLAGVVSLEEAVSISSNGWIAVNGTDSRDPGWTRAFLLKPAQ